MGLLDKVKNSATNTTNSVKDAALSLLGKTDTDSVKDASLSSLHGKTDTENTSQGTGVLGQLKNIVQANSSAQNQAPTWNYTKSDAVLNAEAQLQDYLANKPGEYQSTWQNQLNDTLQQILNREKFSYDLNGDMLYQQYKDQFATQGKLASMDVIGQAAAMSGGYGNSYAQTAGQQAYQGYLQQLNDKVPELYQLALSKYNQEGQALYDQASLMAQMENQDYGRYRDSMSDYYTDLNYLTENARYMSETEYNQALNDFNIKYGAYRDTVSDQQWQATFDEGIRQYDEQFAYKKEQDKIANANTSGSYESSGYKAPDGWDKAKIKEFQKSQGLTVDGIWGPKTQAAYEAYTSQPDYSDWDAGDWEGYFASIRQSEGKAAAEEELKYFTSKGLIPNNMVTYAASGARGGQMGH